MHFGLLEIRPGEPNCFGGFGLMLKNPRARLRAVVGLKQASQVEIDAEEYWEERIRQFLMDWAHRFPSGACPVESVTLSTEFLPHVGLGSGTQVACLVASVLLLARGEIDGMERLSVGDLIVASSRGLRSHIGVNGFLRGGAIVDLGLDHRSAERTQRYPFPDWPILLLRDPKLCGDFGAAERRLFEESSIRANSNRELMLELVEQSIVPALQGGDWSQWDEAIGVYGALAGRVFANSQGGIYRFESIRRVAAFARSIGCHGSVQSSWGPTTAIVAKDEDHARWIYDRLQQEFPELVIQQTKGNNSPVEVMRQS